MQSSRRQTCRDYARMIRLTQQSKARLARPRAAIVRMRQLWLVPNFSCRCLLFFTTIFSSRRLFVDVMPYCAVWSLAFLEPFSHVKAWECAASYCLPGEKNEQQREHVSTYLECKLHTYKVHCSIAFYCPLAVICRVWQNRWKCTAIRTE